jgi:serine/threonine protein kinase
MEFHLLQRLNHANIVKVHELFIDCDAYRVSMVMEYVPGTTLAERIHSSDNNRLSGFPKTLNHDYSRNASKNTDGRVARDDPISAFAGGDT